MHGRIETQKDLLAHDLRRMPLFPHQGVLPLRVFPEGQGSLRQRLLQTSIVSHEQPQE